MFYVIEKISAAGQVRFRLAVNMTHPIIVVQTLLNWPYPADANEYSFKIASNQ